MNTNQIDRLYIGANEVDKLYNGNTLVWEKQQPPVDEGWIMNLNLSRTGVSDDDATGWNPIRFTVDGGGVISDVTGYLFENLEDDQGNNRNVAFSVISNAVDIGISDVNIAGQNHPIPQIYIRDMWATGTPDAAMVWRLDGLDPNSKYDLRGVAYIDPESSARMSVDGGATWTPYSSAYPTTDDFDDPNYLTLNDVSPNSLGQIDISVGSGQSGIWLSILALRIRKQGTPEPPEESMRMLTIEVIGGSDVDILYNEEIQPNNTLLFPDGTQVNDITPTAPGYIFTPQSQSVLMDEDKTITFTATEE